MAWILARLSEPSTHAALCALAASLAASTSGPAHQAAMIAVALLGGAAVATAEKGKA